ncbi:hypothetical protein SADUNF_Sadunf03G0072100 [Salix dunnii]|uniref:BZIP domain-containing protein n=1 Tax=Salix dunnii TaxID=1413687 RepID=A0A835KGD2_9ROSI|nr:hypothetical protein SADUNF_Sadunf03G0072100 [Salix dunnii]
MDSGNSIEKEWDLEDIEGISLDGVPDLYFFQAQVNDTGGTDNTVPTTADPRSRRSINDKAYRARCKEREKSQKEELEKLHAENASMRAENESLKEKVAMLSPKLEEAAREINQLSRESHSLKRTSDYQAIVLQAFTEKMSIKLSDICLQGGDCSGSHDKYKSLHDEAARSSENVIQDPRMQEKKRLLEERSRLENENRLLELKNQAYFMMIQNDKNPAGDAAD